MARIASFENFINMLQPTEFIDAYPFSIATRTAGTDGELNTLILAFTPEGAPVPLVTFTLAGTFTTEASDEGDRLVEGSITQLRADVLDEADGEVGNNTAFSITFDRIIAQAADLQAAIDQGNLQDLIDTILARRDILVGSAGSDGLDGGNARDVLRGLGGDDTLFGGNGRDTLVGGDGLDTLVGSNGDDLLIGGADADRLFGGNDADTFVLSNLAASGDGSDRLALDFIGDFDSAEGDVIALRFGPSNPARWTLTEAAEGESAADAFTGTRREIVVADGLFALDLNGDGTADMAVSLGEGTATLTLDDFAFGR